MFVIAVYPYPLIIAAQYQRVAFTSDLCSAASTIIERPNSSANVHHSDSLLASVHSYQGFFFFFLSRIRLWWHGSAVEEKKSDKLTRQKHILPTSHFFTFSCVFESFHFSFIFNSAHLEDYKKFLGLANKDKIKA